MKPALRQKLPEAERGPTLDFVSRQRTQRLNLPRLRAITKAALHELGIANATLAFYFVGAKQMAEINERHLQHAGPTDVITFDYSEHGTRNAKRGTKNPSPQPPNPRPHLCGEVFICVDVARTQAREFRATWQSELVRYIVHALLHLCGHDDVLPAARRQMKREENRLVRRLAQEFGFAQIARPARVTSARRR